MLLAQFLLTRPLRDVTLPFIVFQWDTMISTHTPLAGRDAEELVKAIIKTISTHTPLAGRDNLVRS